MSPILFQLEGGAVVQGHVLVVVVAIGVIRRPAARDHGETGNGGTAVRDAGEAGGVQGTAGIDAKAGKTGATRKAFHHLVAFLKRLLCGLDLCGSRRCRALCDGYGSEAAPSKNLCAGIDQGRCSLFALSQGLQ